MRAEPLPAAEGVRCSLGESPRWDGEHLWWVDAAAGVVWRWRPGADAVERVLVTGVRTSLVQPATGGRFVVARGGELVVVDAGRATTWCDLGLGAGWLANDGVADASGGLWIGVVAPGQESRAGSLLRVGPDGAVVRVAHGFTLSNGLSWDVTGEALFHADSRERTVWRHRVDPSSGTVLGSEPFLEVADGLPDGIATDTDGGVWVALYGAGQVHRYTPTGTLDLVVEVATPQVTSVELGDGTIFVTTAHEGYDDDQQAAEPLAGRLFHTPTPRRGLSKQEVDPR